MKSEENAGHYLGTEVDGKWWKRYSKNKMMARGNRTYWYDDEAFYFLRLLTKIPIAIQFKDVVEITTGSWHAGKWAGGLVMKMIWESDGKRLNSGCIAAKRQNALEKNVVELNKKIVGA